MKLRIALDFDGALNVLFDRRLLLTEELGQRGIQKETHLPTGPPARQGHDLALNADAHGLGRKDAPGTAAFHALIREEI